LLAQPSHFSIPLRLIVAIVFCHAAFCGNRFIFALHAVALGATPLQIGCLMGALMLVPMFLSVQFGRWSDRFGYTRLCMLGTGMLVAAGLIAASARSIPPLFVASVLTGSGFMMAQLATSNTIGKVAPPGQVTRAFSVLAMSFSLSSLGGPFISGFLIDAWGHAVAYIAMVASSIAGALSLAWAARKYAVSPAPAAVHHARARLADLLRDRALLNVFIAAGLLASAWDLLVFLTPLHGVASGLSAAATGTVVAAFAVGTFVIRIILPSLTQRVGEWHIVAGSLAVTATGFVAFPLLSGLGPLMGASFVLGMALGVSQPVSMTLIFRTAPPHRAGEAVGVRGAITSSSQTVFPLLFGALGTAVGIVAVFWFAALLLIGGAAGAARQSTGNRA